MLDLATLERNLEEAERLAGLLGAPQAERDRLRAARAVVPAIRSRVVASEAS